MQAFINACCFRVEQCFLAHTRFEAKLAWLFLVNKANFISRVMCLFKPSPPGGRENVLSLSLMHRVANYSPLLPG